MAVVVVDVSVSAAGVALETVEAAVIEKVSVDKITSGVVVLEPAVSVTPLVSVVELAIWEAGETAAEDEVCDSHMPGLEITAPLFTDKQ